MSLALNNSSSPAQIASKKERKKKKKVWKPITWPKSHQEINEIYTKHNRPKSLLKYGPKSHEENKQNLREITNPSVCWIKAQEPSKKSWYKRIVIKTDPRAWNTTQRDMRKIK